MTFYYADISHTNSTDDPEEVIVISGTRAEKKHIHSIILFSWTNKGTMKIYKNREQVGTIPTGTGDITSGLELPVDIDLDFGDQFKIELTNQVSGSNASITGIVKYTIE